jgi:Flp pilus assembly protein CpaB
MRRGRMLILVAIVLLLGVAAAFLVMRRLSGDGGAPSEGPQAPADIGQIVIAAQDIARGSVVPENALVISPYPRDLIVETMLTDITQVAGKYARLDIARGMPITENMLTLEPGKLLGEGSKAAVAIPPGFTAISVPITRLSSVAYALRNGDKVDVIVSAIVLDLDENFQSVLPNDTLLLLGQDGGNRTGYACTELKQGERGPECVNPEPPPMGKLENVPDTDVPLYQTPVESQRPRLVSQRLIANATVLQVGSFKTADEEALGQLAAVQPQGVGAPAGAEGQTQTVTPPDVVTLIVTPQDALALNWAMKAGLDLVFTLRGPNDVTATTTTSVTLGYLFDNYRIEVPEPLDFGIEPRLTEPISPVLPNDAAPPAPPQ